MNNRRPFSGSNMLEQHENLKANLLGMIESFAPGLVLVHSSAIYPEVYKADNFISELGDEIQKHYHYLNVVKIEKGIKDDDFLNILKECNNRTVILLRELWPSSLAHSVDAAALFAAKGAMVIATIKGKYKDCARQRLSDLIGSSKETRIPEKLYSALEPIRFVQFNTD